jgi:hypothetical protein
MSRQERPAWAAARAWLLALLTASIIGSVSWAIAQSVDKAALRSEVLANRKDIEEIKESIRGLPEILGRVIRSELKQPKKE